VGIDRITSTAAEAILFTLPALEPEPAEADRAPTLYGWLQADDDVVRLLKQLLQQEDSILRIGHARTRGYGRVHVTIGEEIPAVTSDYEHWSRAMLNNIADAKLDPDRYLLFSLTLPTGAILVDPLLRYTLDPAGMVAWLPPLPPPDALETVCDRPGKQFPAGGQLWCVTAVAQHERLRGWNAAHGLPRQDEWMVARGSVYVYLYDSQGNGAARTELIHKLRELEAEGLGIRRNEGYGQVIVCDDFPLSFAPRSHYERNINP
jgi:CRISPR-associated protein Csx10